MIEIVFKAVGSRDLSEYRECIAFHLVGGFRNTA